MSYFKRGLNPNIAAAVEGKYFRGMQDLLSCAIREEKKIMKVQQDKITRCINLCQDMCSKLQPNVSSVAREKQASTACKKRGHVVPKVSSVDSSAKRSEHQQCNSKKNSIEQQEDNIVPQVDKRNDEVCNVTVDHNVTPTPERVAIPKCRLRSEIVKKEVTYNPINDCLNSKQEKEDKSATHATQIELIEATMPICEIREHLSLFEVDHLSTELKEHAVVPHHGNPKIIQQEAPSQCMNTSIVDPTSLVPCSSFNCGEVTCPKTIQNFSVQHGENLEPKCDQEIDNTLDFKGVSNLNLKTNHSVNLRAECEKKDASIVTSSGSDKSVQDEVYHAPTNPKMQICVISPIVEHDKLLDSGAEIMCSNMPPNVQIEGKINAHDSTPTNASSMSFEEVKDDCLAATIVVPMPLKKIMNDGTYSYVALEDVEVIMHQNPCENESHIAKLSANENKSEMCDSTKSEVESINKRSVRDTPHKKER